MNYHHHVTLPIVVAILVLSASGCGSTRIHNEQSVGQQLQDLDKSYKDGLINEKDYERMKRALIRKHD